MVAGAGLRDFVVALGLVLVLEGVIYTLAPGFMKAAFEEMRRVEEGTLRWGGLAALIVGVALVWMIRG